MIWVVVGTALGLLAGICGTIALRARKITPPRPGLIVLDVGEAFTVLMDGRELEVVVDCIQGDFGAYGRQVRIQLQDAKSWMRERRT